MPRRDRRILLVVVAIGLAAWSAGHALAADKNDGAKKGKDADGEKVPNKSFDALDADGNGNLSMHEIFGKIPKRGTAGRDAFEKADLDHNDWITRAEFQNLQRIAKNGGSGGKKGGKKGGRAKKK